MPCSGVSMRLRSRGLPRLHVAGLIMLAMILFSQSCLDWASGECLQALFGVWLTALFPLSMAYGISHFHAVRRGVEAAQALLPCLDSGLYKGYRNCLTSLNAAATTTGLPGI